MYFNIPKSNERQDKLNKKSSSSSLESITTTNAAMAEERISEIIHNLDDHWGSPPILTPDTLAHILNNQWIKPEEEEDIKKVIVSGAHRQKLKASKSQKVISSLIKELCKTIQGIDTENKFEVTKDLKNDPTIQNFILSKEQDQQPEQVLEHLVELLQYHNNDDNNKA